MQHLLYLDSRIQFVVLTESGPNTNFPGLKEYGVEVVQVPKSFRPEKAMYKARALEYFRRMKAFGDEDWVLHLDEETAVDDHCVLTCLDFIEREVRWDYGQVSSTR